MSENPNYNSLLEQAKAAGTEAARTWIPKLCYALKDEDKDLSKEDIKDRVEKDCVEIWSKSTIRTHIPDEFKDVQKQEAGRKGREKQLEQPIPAGGARETGAENGFFPPIQEESKNLEDINRPNIKSTAQMYGKSQDELKNTKRELKELEAKLEEAKKKAAILQEAQNIDDIPELVDNKIGPVEIKNLSKISQFDRRGYQILAGRFAELIRRKLAAEGRASIKFYVIGKDRTTNIESLVPVSFIVDLKERTTDMILDESRL
jgi:hypothetical protein